MHAATGRKGFLLTALVLGALATSACSYGPANHRLARYPAFHEDYSSRTYTDLHFRIRSGDSYLRFGHDWRGAHVLPRSRHLHPGTVVPRQGKAQRHLRDRGHRKEYWGGGHGHEGSGKWDRGNRWKRGQWRHEGRHDGGHRQHRR